MATDYGKRAAEILAKNRSKQFVERLLHPDQYPVLKNEAGEDMTHLMASSDVGEGGQKHIAYPTIVWDPEAKKLSQLGGVEAEQHALRTGEFIEFESQEEADLFARRYKEGLTIQKATVPFEHVAVNPDFRAMNRAAQREFLAKRSPAFAAMPEKDQDSWLDERVPADYSVPENRLARSALGGFQASVAGSAHTSANALDLAADFLDAAGAEDSSKMLRGGEESMRARAVKYATLSEENRGESIWEKLAYAGGALPVSLGMAGAAAAVAGPIVGFGGLGYLSARDEGTIPALKRAAIDASIGALFPISQHMSRATRIALVGTASAAVSEQEGVDRAIEAGTMGLLAGLAGRRAPSPRAMKLIPGLGKKYQAAQLEVGNQVLKNVADRAMIETAAEDRPFVADQYPAAAWVRVETPDGDVRSDYVHGMNVSHALHRARENWPGSKVELAPGPVDAQGRPIKVDAEGRAVGEGPAERPMAPETPADEARRIAAGPEAEEVLGARTGPTLEDLRTMLVNAKARAYDDNWQVRAQGREDVRKLEARIAARERREAKAKEGAPPEPAAAEAPAPRETQSIVRSEHASEAPREGALGDAGRVMMPSGHVETFHVTDDATPLYRVLTEHRELSEASKPEGVNELGRGLYASGNTKVWDYLTRGKWGFLGELERDHGAVLRLVEAVRQHPNAQLGPIDRGQRARLDQYLDRLAAGEEHPESLITFMGEPYNIDVSRPEFLKPLGIEPGRAPQIIPIEADGRFAEVDGRLTPEEVTQLRDAGYAGAFHKGGLGSTPQLVIWDRHALRQVGEWRPDPVERGNRHVYEEDGSVATERAPERTPDPEPPPRRTPEEQAAHEAKADAERWDPPKPLAAGSWDPGPNHTPNYDVHPATELPKNVVRKGDVIEKLARVFGIPILFGPRGPMKGKAGQGIAGYYRHMWGGGGRGALNVRYWYDLQTSSHEFMHHLNQLYNDHLIANPGTKATGVASLGELVRDPAIGQATNMTWIEFAPSGWVPNGKFNPNLMFQEQTSRFDAAGMGHLSELHKLSYDMKSTEEGAAEFMRLWMTNRTVLPQIAPKFLALWEQRVAALPKKYRKAMLEAQKEMHRYAEQGGLAAAAGSIGLDRNASNVLHNKGDLIREGLSDKFHGLLNFHRKTFGPGADLDDSVYQAVRNLMGRSRIVDGMLQYGVPRFVLDPNRPGRTMLEYGGKSGEEILTPIASSADEFDRFWRWATGKRAAELKKQWINPITGKVEVAPQAVLDLEAKHGVKRTREKLFSLNTIESMLASADDTLIRAPGMGRGLRPRREVYEKVFEDLKEWNRQVLNFATQSGILSHKTRANWERWNQDFIFSFARDFDNASTGMAGKKDPLASKLGVVQLHGSSRPLKDPFQNWIDTYTRFIFAGLENQVRLRLANQSRVANYPGRFIEKIPEQGVMERVDVKRVRTALQNELLRVTGAKWPKEVLDTIFAKGQVEALSLFMGFEKPFGDHVMTVLRRGKPEYYEIRDDQLMRAMAAIRNPQLVGPMKLFNALRSFHQEAITIDPAFTFANFARDLVMSAILRRHGGRHLTAALQAMNQRLRNDPQYRLMIANGGGAATLRGGGLRVMKGDLISRAQRLGHDPRGYAVVANPLEWVKMLRLFGRAVEEAPRLAEFNRARRHGRSAEAASYAAREVSTDFSMMGANAYIQAMAHTIPFLRAMIAGADRFYRGAVRDPDSKVHTLMKLSAFVGAGLTIHAVNRTYFKDELEREPDWLRDTYIPIYFPRNIVGTMNPEFPNDKVHRFYIPGAWEPNTMLKIMERTIDYALDEDPDPIGKTLARRALELIANNFGVHIAAEGFPLPVPVGLDLLFEQWSNKVLFTGSPIVPKEVEDVEDWRQVRANQPELFKRYGEIVKDMPIKPEWLKSPARVEALLRAYFGEITMYAADAMDRMWLDPEGAPRGGPLRPLYRRFYAAEPRDRAVDEFYQRLELFRESARTMTDLEKKGERTLLREERSDPEERVFAQLSTPYDRINRVVQTYNKKIAKIERGQLLTDKTPAEKGVILRQLREKRNAVMRKANEYANRKINRALKKAAE